ncbi:MAG TPA: type II toxin-antitoxin system RelE/ParE family toxin [Polyangium sp.]|nr:type II toxin-antitoxin system RelE/ParE family toxin [Polyangium sp.]
MKLRIKFTPSASVDLDEIVVHIGENNPRAAVQIAERIVQRISLLHEQPLIGRDGRHTGTRELVVTGTRYIVVYRLNTTRQFVEVLRIIHHAQQWPEEL